jgi:lysophospholipase L1-like esterase
VAPSATPTPAPTPSPSPAPAGWLIFGDSITQNAFHDSVAWTAVWGAGTPGVVGYGLRGADSAYALTQEEEVLGLFPGRGGMGLAFGTNDVGHKRTPTAFKATLKALYDRAVAAGRRPLVATIPYSPHADYQAVPAFNAAIAELGLPAGPDLYAWFAQHPEQISPDGIHPTEVGNTQVQRLWAEAAKAAGF